MPSDQRFCAPACRSTGHHPACPTNRTLCGRARYSDNGPAMPAPGFGSRMTRWDCRVPSAPWAHHADLRRESACGYHRCRAISTRRGKAFQVVRTLCVSLLATFNQSTCVRNVHQTISAIEQFRPEPIPSRATRSPRLILPFATALASAMGTAAGPILPSSG